DFAEVEAALERAEIGFETAGLLMRVGAVVRGQLADSLVGSEQSSEQAWLERARRRTFKHLREEVRAAELAAQQAGVPALPPSEETMQRLIALEGRVKSG